MPPQPTAAPQAPSSTIGQPKAGQFETSPPSSSPSLLGTYMAALQASGANRVPGPTPKAAPRAAQQTHIPAFSGAGTHHAATLYFANGSAKIATKDRATLRRIALESRSRGAVIRVVGYASPTAGNLSPAARKLANFNISFRRAEAVRKALIQAGAASENVQIVAASDNSETFIEPSAANDTRPRVEIFLEN